MTTRREFLTTAAAVTALGPVALARLGQEGRKMKILFLGGTGFIGPHIVRDLLDRGHEVTLFNRGSREEMFGDLELIKGNRIVGEGEGLDPLKGEIEKGRAWDAVIDTASVHTWVENSASLLAGASGWYLFTSSLSAYADNSKIDMDETSEALCEMPAEEAAKIDRLPYNMEYYGAVKVLCERAAEEYFPGRATILRPGLIVGPRDFSNRFTYWPWRVRQGDEVLAPGKPEHPVMFIDARDLAAFVVRLLETKTPGIFNTNGPTSRDMTIGKLLDACKTTTGSDATFTWADAEWLAERGVNAWAQMPVWVPPTDGMEGFHRMSLAKSIAAGLTTRPVAETITDTLAWLDTEYIPKLEEKGMSFEPGVRAPGVSRERETELLAEWHARENP